MSERERERTERKFNTFTHFIADLTTTFMLNGFLWPETKNQIKFKPEMGRGEKKARG